MRIGVVTTSYPRYPGEPAGNFVAELTSWLLDCGHEVEVIAAGCGHPTDSWHRAHVIRVPADANFFYAGGAPDALQGLGMMSSLRAKVAAANFSIRLTHTLRSRVTQYDGIVAHWLVPCALSAVLTAPQLPIWAIAHGGDVHTLTRLKLTRFATELFDRPNVHLNSVSRSLQSEFFSSVRSAHNEVQARSSVHPMGIDLPRFQCIAESRKKRKPSKKRTVLFLGRLIELKGVDILMEALVGVSAHVVIAGAGPAEKALKSRARSLGLAIDWRGEVGIDDRDKLLEAADIVVMPSRQSGGRREGMPLVAMEALAAGTQLIVSDSGGLAEIPESICHQVPAGDAGALRDTIQRILGGERARFLPGHWLEERSWDAIAAKILPGMTPVH